MSDGQAVPRRCGRCGEPLKPGRDCECCLARNPQPLTRRIRNAMHVLHWGPGE